MRLLRLGESEQVVRHQMDCKKTAPGNGNGLSGLPFPVLTHKRRHWSCDDSRLSWGRTERSTNQRVEYATLHSGAASLLSSLTCTAAPRDSGRFSSLSRASASSASSDPEDLEPPAPLSRTNNARDARWRSRRHFSEDSGLSSCVSSASSLSSVNDEESAAPVSGSSGVVSVTVASVLAAGAASDSSDQGESDCEESDDVFADLGDGTSDVLVSQIRVSLQTLLAGVDSKQEPVNKAVKGPMTAMYLGRDFLDLGANMVAPFKLTAAELPEADVRMFMQNRSQYHRLGKFGVSEEFCMEHCFRGCGFSYPVPNSTRTTHKTD